MSDRNRNLDTWKQGDEDTAALEDEAPFKVLTREEAQALRAKNPPVSPWRVIAIQTVVGTMAAMLAWLVMGRKEVMWSVLYGAATVVVPSALLVRGLTRRFSTPTAPGARAVGFMVWELAKIGLSVAMLALAPEVVQQLSWPALLVGLIACMKVYWVAGLRWRRH